MTKVSLRPSRVFGLVDQRFTISLFFFAIFAVSNWSEAQTCLPNAALVQNASDTFPAGSDGLVHLTFSFVDSSGNAQTPDANVAAAFSAAASAWNSQSSNSGIQLSPAPPGELADIQVQQTTDATGNTGGCAAYHTDTGRINYGETFMQAVQANSVGTTIFSHELGHALGLGEGGTNPSPPSIMNNPSNPPPGGCTAPQVPTTQVQASDGTAVKACVAQGRAYKAQEDAKFHAKFTIDAPYTTVQTSSPVCFYTYGTEYFYVDGTLDSTEPYLSNVVCQ